MKLDKKEAAVLDKAIEKWEEDELINAETASTLKKSYESTQGDYKTLTFYAFVAAVSCALLAFGALVLDEKWIERMRKYFAFSEITIAAIFVLVTALFAWWAIKRKQKFPLATLANESFSILLVLSSGIAIAYFGKGFAINESKYYYLIFAAGITYGVLAFLVQSRLLWIAMILAFAGWWASYSYTMSSLPNHSFYLGMNMPMRLTVFSALVVVFSFLVKKIKALEAFYAPTYFAGWIMFLFTAWGLSIVGNYSFEAWSAVRQTKMAFWALGYTVLLLGLLFYALKNSNTALRDIVLVFLILNIYTRYFEYFWDITNKGLFFAILALSFWWIGKKLEQYRKKTTHTIAKKQQ